MSLAKAAASSKAPVVSPTICLTLPLRHGLPLPPDLLPWPAAPRALAASLPPASPRPPAVARLPADLLQPVRLAEEQEPDAVRRCRREEASYSRGRMEVPKEPHGVTFWGSSTK